MSLEQLANFAIAAGGVITLVSIVFALHEYIRNGTLRRADDFIMLRRRLKENETFRRICGLLDRDDPALAGESFENKRDLVGLFEEVALMLNSGLMRKQVAHYMFGFYAIQCYESRHFWANMNLASPYWSLFRDFAEKMKHEQQTFQYRASDYRL
jgi:hypothetical protein